MQQIRCSSAAHVTYPGDDVWSLCERLRVERLLITSLQELHNEITKKFLELGLLSWNDKQHQLLLHRLVSSHNCVSQDNSCALSSQLNSAVIEEAYRCGKQRSYDLSNNDATDNVLTEFQETLTCLMRVQLLAHPNPRLVIRKGTAAFPRLYKLYSESLYTAKIFLTAALHDSVMLVLCQDEVFLDIDPAKTLTCLMRVQLLAHPNPRLVIRKGTAAFPRLYKLYSESLYTAKIFLTAALHDSVMLVLCQDEVFLDIDPAKSPLRFPSADRIRRFGDDPTSTQYHKRVAAHRKLIVEKLVLLTHSFIKGICDAISCFPVGLIWLVQQLNSALIEVKRFPPDEAALICTDLIFTNLLCPAIINPENNGIISDTPISHIARFNLMQIGQIIQTLALSRHETPQPHFQIFMSQFKDRVVEIVYKCSTLGADRHSESAA
ncbi:GTPase-activator protein [Oesophagostomum dentatum]|uniref:GTPase-activator protein n=1 Tax=Oesophagostomum dentatum TaxID=61180 RepID=A0A0B1TPF4_OESDE|nr:GTPase-activator protein [Oesophagostomum dentatum]